METMRKPGQVAALLATLVVGFGSSAGRTLAPTPPLAGGSRGGAAAIPAIGFPSPGAIAYRVGSTLPSLPIHATLYRADDTTTSTRVARLAEALGLSDSVRGTPPVGAFRAATSVCRCSEQAASPGPCPRREAAPFRRGTRSPPRHHLGPRA
jgi:hypothetical protein